MTIIFYHTYDGQLQSVSQIYINEANRLFLVDFDNFEIVHCF